MEINENDKIKILLNLLNERYNASHRMRERSLNFAIWILGFGVAIAWLLLGGVSLTVSQKVILTPFLIIISALTIYFLHAIKKGFDNNRNIMIDIERVLGCYEKGIYLNTKPLFPKEYEENKKGTSSFRRVLKILGSHFVSIYIWIIAVALMIMFLIWFSPSK